jgi:hypothetical protein
MRDSIFIPKHKTNILPLRWLANYIFHPASMFFFHIGLKANDKLYYDYSSATLLDEVKEKVVFKIYSFLNYPYAWWGTTYLFDSNIINLDELGGVGWDDYDYTGHPYWDYLWHNDEITGDGWRLISKV